jgi:hypothetical protein
MPKSGIGGAEDCQIASPEATTKLASQFPIGRLPAPIAKKSPEWHRCMFRPNAELCIEDVPHRTFQLVQSHRVG